MSIFAIRKPQELINNFVKVFARKTEIKYMEPFLVLKNAWTSTNSENRGIKNVVIDHEISTIINMELIDIVEAVAYTKYQYTSNYNVYTIKKSNMELYKKLNHTYKRDHLMVSFVF